MATTGTVSFYENFVTILKSRYPQTAQSADVESRLSANLICPEKIQLPKKMITEVREIVAGFWELRNSSAWQSRLVALEPNVLDQGNASVLMSYDFHVDSSGQLRLIEINTNASMSLIADLQNEVQEVENPFSKNFRETILESFLEEWRATKIRSERTPQTLAITDENPEAQRLFIEFLLYRELFEKGGIATSIVDAKDFKFDGALKARGEIIDFVYNRHTDFYFETEETKALRQAMEQNAACISPHPFEYRLLADKERLLELSRPGAIDALEIDAKSKAAISRALIRTLEVKEFESPEALWKERKKYFFKPMRSFGGKATYRGSSITKGSFATIFDEPYVAQEFVPAPTVTLNNGEEFKYDLRFYVYRDQVQLACARLYKGQMTNSQTLGGGIAPIDFSG